MAYTPLTTQVAGGVASAAGWANLVKGNFEVMPHRIPKTVDQSVTSSTALVDDTDLQFAIGVSEAWEFRFVCALPSAPGQWKVALNAPTGATGWWSLRWTDASANDVLSTVQISATFVDGEVLSTNNAGPAVNTIEGFCLNSTTAGTFKLRWAQASANATATTVKRGSRLERRKV